MTWKPDYQTVAVVKNYLEITDTVDDVLLGTWISAASRAIDRKCNRQFGSLAAPAVRTYRRAASWNPVAGMYAVDIDDVQTATGLLVGGVAYASAGAVLLPDNAPADGLPYTALGWLYQPAYYPAAPLVVTATWGWTAVPVQVAQAVLLQVARWNFRRNSPNGMAGSPDQGSEVRLLSKLDPDVATTLAGLTRKRRVG